jgi:hypothetical protein
VIQDKCDEIPQKQMEHDVFTFNPYAFVDPVDSSNYSYCFSINFKDGKLYKEGGCNTQLRTIKIYIDRKKENLLCKWIEMNRACKRLITIIVNIGCSFLINKNNFEKIQSIELGVRSIKIGSPCGETMHASR